MSLINNSLNIDKSNWKLIKLIDLAEEISERVNNPDKSSYERFVSLDHFVSGDIKIKNWQTTEKLVSAAKEFKAGDVLFARRNAYLRRASLVDFDGCCSGDAFVLRENHKVVPGFLVYVMNSSKLWDYAISNAAGTMSKRVKWRDLSEYKILLPPKNEQEKLIKLLLELDQLIESEKNLFKCVDDLFKIKIKYISDNDAHKGEYRKIKEVCKIKDNLRKPLNKSQRNKIKGDIPYYGSNGLADLVNKFIFDEDLVLIAEDGGNFNEFYSKKIAYMISGKSWVNNHAHVLSADNKIISTEWLLYSLMHKNIIKFIIGTTRLKLNKSALENIMIWVPSYKKMKLLSDEVQNIALSRKNILDKISLSKKLQKNLINQIF